jgi:hypothetical protein
MSLKSRRSKLDNALLYFLAAGAAASAAAFASVGLAAGAGALASAGLASEGFPGAGLGVAGALFCALASSFFSGFADEAPHSLVLLQVISLAKEGGGEGERDVSVTERLTPRLTKIGSNQSLPDPIGMTYESVGVGVCAGPEKDK